MELIIGIVIGIILGMVIGIIIMSQKLMDGVAGALIMNNQDPEETPFFLELSSDPDYICQSKFIKLEVNASGYTPRKK